MLLIYKHAFAHVNINWISKQQQRGASTIRISNIDNRFKISAVGSKIKAKQNKQKLSIKRDKSVTCSSQSESFYLKGRLPQPSCKDEWKLVLALGRTRMGCWAAAPTNQMGDLWLLEGLCPSPSQPEGSHQAAELYLCERTERKAPRTPVWGAGHSLRAQRAGDASRACCYKGTHQIFPSEPLNCQ